VRSPVGVCQGTAARGRATSSSGLSRKATSEVKRERALIYWASATRTSPQQIAALVDTDKSHVRKVVDAFDERGFSSLDPEQRAGRHRATRSPDRTPRPRPPERRRGRCLDAAVVLVVIATWREDVLGCHRSPRRSPCATLECGGRCPRAKPMCGRRPSAGRHGKVRLSCAMRRAGPMPPRGLRIRPGVQDRAGDVADANDPEMRDEVSALSRRFKCMTRVLRCRGGARTRRPA